MTETLTDGLRDGELSTDLPAHTDASLFFIGTLHTPWRDRDACPRRGDLDGPLCRAVIDERWAAALDGIETHAILDLLYWMHLGRRDLVRQKPKRSERTYGTFALRSPMRPNPIAVSSVRLVKRQGTVLLVQGLDCVDGTPLIDVKPNRCPMWPPA